MSGGILGRSDVQTFMIAQTNFMMVAARSNHGIKPVTALAYMLQHCISCLHHVDPDALLSLMQAHFGHMPPDKRSPQDLDAFFQAIDRSIAQLCHMAELRYGDVEGSA